MDICIRDDGVLCLWFPVTRAFVWVTEVGAVFYLESIVLTCGLMFKKSNVACSGSISWTQLSSHGVNNKAHVVLWVTRGCQLASGPPPPTRSVYWSWRMWHTQMEALAWTPRVFTSSVRQEPKGLGWCLRSSLSSSSTVPEQGFEAQRGEGLPKVTQSITFQMSGLDGKQAWRNLVFQT